MASFSSVASASFSSVADTCLRRAEPVPSALATTADQLKSGEISVPEKPLVVNPARDRTVALATAGVLLGALVLVLGYGALSRFYFSPTAAAARYLQAVSSKDASAALELLDPDALPGELTEAQRAALSSAAQGGLPAYEITDTAATGDSARVTVHTHADGDLPEHTWTLGMTAKGTRFGLFPDWRVGDGLGTLDLSGDESVDVASLTLNGRQLGSGTYDVLPGAYTVGGHGAGPFGEVVARRVFVAPSALETLNAEAPLKPEARAKADAAVKAFVDACASQKVAQPEGCPFSHWGFDEKNITWKVASYPTVNLDVANGLSVRTTQPGRVTYSAQECSLGNCRPVTDELPVEVNSALQWDGNASSTASLGEAPTD